MTTKSASSTVGCNTDYSWNSFDSVAYLEHNYQSVRSDDQQILNFVRKFLSGALATSGAPAWRRGIDVGTGANLYPALAMLPFCREITLYEHSQSNVDWLNSEKKAAWPSWETAWHRFWSLLTNSEPYQDFPGDPRTALTERTKVVPGNVFDLSPEDGRWDIGTMFFVAESITSQPDEFRSAVDHFLSVLTPNAPFAIAFMEHSKGYTVGNTRFPATDIGQSHVQSCLDERATEVCIEHIGTGQNPLRDGYSGMLIACGLVKEQPNP